MMALAVQLNLLILFSVCSSESGSDYYSVFGIPRFASQREVKKAFHQLALELHPDRNFSPDAHQVFTQIARAYEVLSDEKTRQLYDQRNKMRDEQDMALVSHSKVGGDFTHSVLKSFSLDDLLEMLQKDEDLILNEEPYGWSFISGDEDQYDDDDYLSEYFGTF